MKNFLHKLLTAMLFLAMAHTPALADTASFSGTVIASRTHEVYASSDSIIQSIPVKVGQAVTASDPIASLRTNKIYAEEDGTISAVFGQIGDLTDTIAQRYGGVITIESPITYTLLASSDSAYESAETRTVYVGETVYLRSRNTREHTGTGMITAVEGSSYTIHVLSGEFLLSESVNVYRSKAYEDSTRIGRGEIERNNPLTVTGTGRIAALYVQAGDTVRRGDLLMETLDGSDSNRDITAGVDGIIASILVTQGTTVSENEVLSVIWPSDAMQIEIAVGEEDLRSISIGSTVNLTWNADNEPTQTGTVAFISAVSDENGSDIQYIAYIDFIPDDSIRYGMSVSVDVVES